MTEHRCWHKVIGGQREPLHHTRFDRLAVNRFRDGLTHTQIFKGVFGQCRAVFCCGKRRHITLLIQVKEDNPMRRLC